MKARDAIRCCLVSGVANVKKQGAIAAWLEEEI
jgi:hypothetical protein